MSDKMKITFIVSLVFFYCLYVFSAYGPAILLHIKIKPELPVDEFYKIIENHRYNIHTSSNDTLKNVNEFKKYLETPNSMATVHFSFYGWLIWGSYQFHVSYENPGKIKEISNVRYWPSM